jgi:hypothetical protein
MALFAVCLGDIFLPTPAKVRRGLWIHSNVKYAYIYSYPSPIVKFLACKTIGDNPRYFIESAAG